MHNAKLMFHMLSLLAKCGQCSYSDGAYSVHWSTSGELASFVLTAKTTGWVGIGFSRDTQMVRECNSLLVVISSC